MLPKNSGKSLYKYGRSGCLLWLWGADELSWWGGGGGGGLEATVGSHDLCWCYV